jgi:hypothetical protein
MGCDDDSGGGRGGTNSDPNSQETDGPDNSELVTQLDFNDLSSTELNTSDSDNSSCLEASVKASAEDGSAVESAAISFSISPQQQDVEDQGTLEPASATTDADGLATTTFCPGKSEYTGSLIAKVNDQQANSGTFQVSKSGSYTFQFVEANIEPIVEEGSEESIIILNLADSGPHDCTTLFFSLTKNEQPVIDKEVSFYTQPDFPKGSKLAKKNADGTIETDETTGKQRAVHTTRSNGEGRLAVPVCAGVSLGTLLVSASITEDDGRKTAAQSPVISIRSGFTNYLNFSLTFSQPNARTLKGYFNTNSNHTLETNVKLGSRDDGDPITDYPVGVAAETGKIQLVDGGLISGSGQAAFKMNALHMVDNYAFPVDPFSGYPDARIRCEPTNLAASLGGDPSLDVNYSDLNRNWRSTVVYFVRGQEHYHDANRNGFYDANGDGFWDKNQNGVFDGPDVLTYDHNDNGSFDYTGEWFIDLPTPFIDVDENLNYDEEYDILIGDSYSPPNGQRDNDTVLWKYEYFPIYMGTSLYGMQRYRIQSDYTLFDPNLSASYFAGTRSSSSVVFGTAGLDDTAFFGAGATDATKAAGGMVHRHIFAHGLCGNPLPGGTTIEVTSEITSAAPYGQRNITTHFYVQPFDDLLEPSRRLLTETIGKNSAKMNFNAPDHRAAPYGYPVTFNMNIEPCNNECSGAVKTAGVACGATSLLHHISFKETKETGGDANTISSSGSFSSIKTCACADGATFDSGTCSCPDGTEFDGATSCVAI